MFHQPSTPRNNSSNFEWTIDDVSHLRPANVQVDESQFHITQDPTLEAEVQEAIKTFFNETDIGKDPCIPLFLSQTIYSCIFTILSS